LSNTISSVVKKKCGERTYYFGTIGADKIKAITFVPTMEGGAGDRVEDRPKVPLEQDFERGYQRPGSPSRMKAFSNYLVRKPTSVIPPVVLSSRDQWIFTPTENEDYGTLTIKGPAAIVDGQHRLGGYTLLYETDNDARDVPFIVIPGLTVDQERDEFTDVNNTQVGVPKAHSARIGDSQEAEVAWQVNERSDSPFHAKISAGSMKKHHLFALHSVAKTVRRLFSLGLQELDVETKVEYTMRLWQVIGDLKPEMFHEEIAKLDDPAMKGRRDFKYKLLELTGLIAWSHAGSLIFQRSYTDSMGMNWDNVKRLVDACDDVDWDKEGQFMGRTGEVGGKLIADDMIRKLPPELKV
jgi:DNA sulfur modification protein DndB